MRQKEHDMYLHRIQIENIRAIQKFVLELKPEEYAGWHVIIGDNGAGKSSFVRSVALALAGPKEAQALRQDWTEWLRADAKDGSIELLVDQDKTVDRATGGGPQLKNFYIRARLVLDRDVPGDDQPLELMPHDHKPDRYLWGTGSGWFSASYGPFRRFSGGKAENEKLFYRYPRLAPHLSAFGEDVALTECLAWLQQLHVSSWEDKSDSAKQTLKDIRRLLNEGEMLPHGTRFQQVTSKAVFFKDGNGNKVPVDQLSDGYRSVLSMTFELLRQMVRAYGDDKVFAAIRDGDMHIPMPGVVVVDEIDAHLHPTWQRRIGGWFRKYFPKIQFFVTTHSPLVCQSADQGTIWRLPKPGGDTKTSGRIQGRELQQLLFGDVLEAYGTELFGSDIGRSEVGQNKLSRLAELNQKSRRQNLTATEKKELVSLRAAMPTMM